jgi:hypothetical protein
MAPSTELHISPEEAEWVRSFARRPGPSAPPVHDICWHLLARRSVDEDVRPLLAALEDTRAKRWKDRALAAWALGKVRIPKDAQRSAVTLLSYMAAARRTESWVARGCSRSLLSGLPIGLLAGCGLFLGAILAAIPAPPGALLMALGGIAVTALVTLLSGLVLWPIVLPISAAIDAGRLRRQRLEAVRSLAAMGNIHAVAALAVAKRDSDAQIRHAARWGLMRTLPLLSEAHFGHLSSMTVPNLASMVWTTCYADGELAMLALDALAKVGDSRAIGPLESIDRNWKNQPEVLEAARKSLVVLYERRRNEQAGQVLLRATDAPPDQDAILLRPAGAGQESVPELLLRASESSTD